MCYVLSLGCRGTVYQTTDLKKSTGRTYLNKLCLTSHVSCKNSAISVSFSSFLFSTFFVLSCSVVSFFPCLCALRVLSGAAPLPGVDTVAGRLQECEAVSQVSGSVSVLPTSITKQLRSLYSHQLPRRSLVLGLYCLRVSENHLKLLVNTTRPEQN